MWKFAHFVGPSCILTNENLFLAHTLKNKPLKYLLVHSMYGNWLCGCFPVLFNSLWPSHNVVLGKNCVQISGKICRIFGQCGGGEMRVSPHPQIALVVDAGNRTHLIFWQVTAIFGFHESKLRSNYLITGRVIKMHDSQSREAFPLICIHVLC